MGRTVTSKFAVGKRPLLGKENGTLAGGNKEYLEQLPPAPTHHIPAHRQPEMGYDRYTAIREYGQRDGPPLPAW